MIFFFLNSCNLCSYCCWYEVNSKQSSGEENVKLSHLFSVLSNWHCWRSIFLVFCFLRWKLGHSFSLVFLWWVFTFQWVSELCLVLCVKDAAECDEIFNLMWDYWNEWWRKRDGHGSENLLRLVILKVQDLCRLIQRDPQMNR